MANYVKSLRGCVAPFFVVYTILVTYFLAQSAWDDVSNRLRRRNDIRFLDVLVQEERRHLRSFQDVVKNYRNDVRIPVGEHYGEPHDADYKRLNKSIEPFSDTNMAHLELDSRAEGSDFFKDDSEDGAYNETYLPKDLRLRLEQQARENKAPKPIFQVEVEEWDANVEHSKPLSKTSNYSLESSAPARFENRYVNNFQNVNMIPGNSKSKSYNQSAMQPQKNENIYRDVDYTSDFCDNVFDVFGQRPTICKRELVESGSNLHVNISAYSLLFRGLGDMFIFSAFLDTRETSYFIRLMTLGPRGRDNSKSVYWCVFYLRNQVPNPNTVFASGLNRTVIDMQNSQRQGTRLTYYSASDGHNKNSQFYIMSCPVPDLAKTSLLPPYRGLFQVVIGDLQRPFLAKGQDSLTLRVIRNNVESTLRHAKSAPQGRSYFDTMEQDLLTLSVAGVTGNNNNLNISSSRGMMSNSKQMQGVTDVNTKTDIEISYLENDSGDKIVSCVAPLQGSIGVVQLVEFIELTLLLGSQHVVFYTFQVADEIRKVLTMYEGRGLVTVLPWNLPAPESVWANGRDMALNDCLYRTMHVYKYALFLDVDEFLVPRVTPDIPSFLKYLKVVHKFNSTRFSDLIFSSAYFPPPTKAHYKNLTTVDGFTRDVNKFVSLKSIHRTYFNPKHTLRMIKLAKAFRVGAGERKRTSFTISSRFAVVNHYSYCPQDANNGNKNSISLKQGSGDKNSRDICSHTKQDFIMWRYKSVLIQRVKDSVRRLNRG